MLRKMEIEPSTLLTFSTLLFSSLFKTTLSFILCLKRNLPTQMKGQCGSEF